MELLMTDEEMVAAYRGGRLHSEIETNYAQQHTAAYVMGLEAASYRRWISGKGITLRQISMEDYHRGTHDEERLALSGLYDSMAFIYGEEAGYHQPILDPRILGIEQ